MIARRWFIILAEDFCGWSAAGEAITKAKLMINPSAQGVKSVAFSEQSIRGFGDTAISRGRLRIELEDGRVVVDQHFLRVFARRDGVWRAVSVAVTPVGA